MKPISNVRGPVAAYWIPTKTALPTTRIVDADQLTEVSDMLLFFVEGETRFGYMVKATTWTDTTTEITKEVDFYFEEAPDYERHCYFEWPAEDVIAWMPLPEEPEIEQA